MDVAEQENVLLPSEVNSDEESPYLRRQKAVAVRRKRFSRRLRWVFFGLFVLVPVGLAGYAVASLALTSRIFFLTSESDVLLSGNHVVSSEDVLSALGFPSGARQAFGMNIFRLSLSQKRKEVESILWVRSATVSRSFPHRLAVHVTERTPIGFVNTNGYLKLVDGDGIILEKPDKAEFDFPLLTGLDSTGSAEERKARVDLFQEFSRDLGEETTRSGWLVSEVDLSDAEDLKALLVQGSETIRVHFGHRDFLERFRNFLGLLPEIRKTNTKIESVDLRFRRQIIVNPAGQTEQNQPGARTSEKANPEKD